MTDRVPLSLLYREGRQRLASLVNPLGGGVDDGVPVPATPGWTVHDAVAHLTGVAQDVVTGTVPRRATPEWTATHLARGRGVPTAELFDRWEQASVAVEELLAAQSVWPLVLDVGAHEQDVRGALGDTGARDCALVTIGAKVMLGSLDVPAPLLIRIPDREFRVGPDGSGQTDQVPTMLTTTSFEAFRWRLGRRSRAQLAAMAWSADPEPFLDHLCIFGPAEHDVVE